jgi:hypothetical protein
VLFAELKRLADYAVSAGGGNKLMSEPLDIFYCNPQVSLYGSKYGGDYILSSCCELIEAIQFVPDYIVKRYKPYDEPNRRFATGACIIDVFQKKAWIYSSEISCEWSYWLTKGDKDTDNRIILHHIDEVPRLWQFILVKKYNQLVDNLKASNNWHWGEVNA